MENLTRRLVQVAVEQGEQKGRLELVKPLHYSTFQGLWQGRVSDTYRLLTEVWGSREMGLGRSAEVGFEA